MPADSKSIVASAEDIGEIKGKGSDLKVWLEKYPDASEKIDEGLPEPRGAPISTTVYFDSDHVHDLVTRRLVSGVIVLLVQRLLVGLARGKAQSSPLAIPPSFVLGR